MKPLKIPLQYKVQNGLYVRVAAAVGQPITQRVGSDVWGAVENIERQIIINTQESITYVPSV